MAPPLKQKILLALGHQALTRHGTALWRRGLQSRGGEIPYTLTRADASTCATFVDWDGVVRTAPANALRIDYSPFYVNGLVDAFGIPYRGLLLEGQRTNALDNGSADSDAVGWNNNGLTSLTRDTGNNPAFGAGHVACVFPNTSGVGPFLTLRAGGNVAASPAQVWAGTVWIKTNSAGAVSYNLRLDWYNGVTFLSSSTATISVTGAYQRFAVRGTAPASTTGVQLVCFTNGAQGIHTSWFDLAKLEQAVFESSDIPTNSATVTRAGDLLTLPFNFGPVDLTTFVRLSRPLWADSGATFGFNPAAYRIGSSGGGNRLEQYAGSSVRSFASQIVSGTTQLQSLNIPAGAMLTIAAQYKGLAVGGQVQEDIGGGYSGFSAAATAMAAFGTQTMVVGALQAGQELYGVLLDLFVAQGLYSLADMAAIQL